MIRNILIFKTTEGDLRLKLTDFGLSRIIDSKTLTTKLGTTGYQSPEMQNGQVTNEKTDIWFLLYLIVIKNSKRQLNLLLIKVSWMCHF